MSDGLERAEVTGFVSRGDVMELGLRRIMGTTCETSTAGLGSCYTDGRSPVGRYGAERCCNPCIAWATLKLVETAGRVA